MERVYISVNSNTDSTGFMLPIAVIWEDGRTFPIETVRDYRPASRTITRYTVTIHGQERQLFFERWDPLFPSRFGRWFVQR